MDRRLWLVALTLLVAVAFAGPGDPRPAPPARAASAGHTPEDPAAVAAARAVAAERARARRAARQAQARRLRRSSTVKGALRRAWLSGAIGRRRHAALRRTWWLARRDVGRLSGTRRAELAAVVGMVERLARGRMLTASRLEPVFLTLRRNREFWTTRPLIAARSRLSFRGDPVIFEYYAGCGLAIQPLASFGRANALSARRVPSLTTTSHLVATRTATRKRRRRTRRPGRLLHAPHEQLDPTRTGDRPAQSRAPRRGWVDLCPHHGASPDLAHRNRLPRRGRGEPSPPHVA